MIQLRHNASRSRSYRRSVTLVEMVISIILVGTALVAALNTLGASKLAAVNTGDARQGHLLAQELMAEILMQDYADAGLIKTVRTGLSVGGAAAHPIGRDNLRGINELAGPDRSLFDDVDDYDGWTASPPENNGGVVYAELAGWTRSVSVGFTTPIDLKVIAVKDYGCKRITVTVTHDDKLVAELVAIKTVGLPPLEACCYADGTCEDLRDAACTVAGGSAQGYGTSCAMVTCNSTNILMVVTDPASLNAQELARQALLVSWDFGVTLIAASAPQAMFDLAVADADAAYVPLEIDENELTTKLKDAPLGVVNEHPFLIYDFEFSSGTLFAATWDEFSVLDNTHPITSVFDIGAVTILTTPQDLLIFGTFIAPDVWVLGEIGSFTRNWAFAYAETGGIMADMLPAAGRRVQMPWGVAPFDIQRLTADGKTMLKRSIQWAAGIDMTVTLCGDGTCASGEECSCVDDCGVPTAFEQAGVDCDDGLDNDCDGPTDCDDINCAADPSCVVTVCGNGTCEVGEDCFSCSADCKSKLSGKTSNRYCCGNGIEEASEGDGSRCDGNY